MFGPGHAISSQWHGGFIWAELKVLGASEEGNRARTVMFNCWLIMVDTDRFPADAKRLLPRGSWSKMKAWRGHRLLFPDGFDNHFEEGPKNPRCVFAYSPHTLVTECLHFESHPLQSWAGVYFCAGCLAAGTKQALWLVVHLCPQPKPKRSCSTIRMPWADDWNMQIVTQIMIVWKTIESSILLTMDNSGPGTPTRWSLTVDVDGLAFGPMPTP